jgi:hypothetical protein
MDAAGIAADVSDKIAVGMFDRLHLLRDEEAV